MARSPIVIEVKNTAGDVVPSGSVNIKVRATGSNATLYNAETGGSTISNPVSVDSLGRMICWVDRGNYNAIITGTGITGYTIPLDAAPAGNRDIDLLWGAANLVPTINTATGSSTTPASPVDGDRLIWAPNIAQISPMEFRYRAGSPSSYKWECIGGGGFLDWIADPWDTANRTASNGVQFSLNTGWTSGANLAIFTCPFAGEYDVFWFAGLRAAFAGLTTLTCGASVNATTPNQGSSAESVGQSTFIAAVKGRSRVTVAAGDTIQLMGSQSGTASQTIKREGVAMQIVPVRVA